MLHARKDYNRRIQDSENLIGEDEPVFLLRAKDMLMQPVLRHYLYELRQGKPFDGPLEAGVIRLLAETKRWQEGHTCKQPDMPEEELVSFVNDEDSGAEVSTENGAKSE